MKQKYEYKFIRLGKKDGIIFSSTNPQIACDEYKLAIEAQAKNGWRFVQVFAPPIAAYGSAPWVELIFEREIDS